MLNQNFYMELAIEFLRHTPSTSCENKTAVKKKYSEIFKLTHGSHAAHRRLDFYSRMQRQGCGAKVKQVIKIKMRNEHIYGKWKNP